LATANASLVLVALLSGEFLAALVALGEKNNVMLLQKIHQLALNDVGKDGPKHQMWDYYPHLRRVFSKNVLTLAGPSATTSLEFCLLGERPTSPIFLAY
jgi:hypothetical protein